MTDEEMARLFHSSYEALAPTFGYETRTESAVPWEDVPENNRQLMIACAHVVNKALEQEPMSGWRRPGE